MRGISDGAADGAAPPAAASAAFARSAFASARLPFTGGPAPRLVVLGAPPLALPLPPPFWFFDPLIASTSYVVPGVSPVLTRHARARPDHQFSITSPVALATRTFRL